MSAPGRGLSIVAIAIGVIAIVMSGFSLITFYTTAAYQPKTRTFEVKMGEGEIVGENVTTGEEIIIGEFHRWEPNTITVFKGDTVVLTVKNPRGHIHSLELATFGVNTGDLAARGGEKTVTFVADEAGVFQYRCDVGYEAPDRCDPDHVRQVGYLIVLEP